MAGAALRGTARISALKWRDLMVADAQEVLWIHSVVTTGIPQKRNKPLDFLKPRYCKTLLWSQTAPKGERTHAGLPGGMETTPVFFCKHINVVSMLISCCTRVREGLVPSLETIA